MEELQRFGAHTRQRKATLTELGQKWLALHSGGGAPAYALVASDWALLEARTHSPPLKNYLEPVDRAVDPADFVWITKNGFAQATPLSETQEQQWPRLAQMCETLWPKPMGEEAWQPWERRDHWKDRAYFLATMGSRARPQFYGMVDAIYRDGRTPSDQDHEAVAELYTKLQRYGANEAHWPTAREIGSLIATLDLEHVEEVVGGRGCVEARRKHLAKTGRKEPAAPPDEENNMSAAAPLVFQADPIQLGIKVVAPEISSDARFQTHAGLAAFRRRHLIPPTFDTRNVAKQMVLASVGAPVPTHLMAAAQRRALGTTVTPVAGECDAELVNALLDSVPHDTLVKNLNLVSPSLQTYYWGQRDCATMTAHEFVGRLLLDEARPKVADESLIKTIHAL